MAEHLPYKAEYAKSDRSSCKACKEKIEKEALRIAAVVQSPAFDGIIPKWYHYMCFFTKQRPKAVGDIENFENLKWDDQEKIREKVASVVASEALNGSAGGKKGTKRGAGGAKKADAKKLFKCELAKSNRSTCRGCHNIIVKGELRVAKMDYESDEGRRYGGMPLWHHAECFVKLRSDLEFWDSADTLGDYQALDKENKKKLKTLLPAIKDKVDGASAPKKTKEEPLDDKETEALKKQVERLQKYTTLLKTFTRGEINEIMEHNKEPSLKQSSNVERIADAMAFGWPKDCEKCKTGKLKYKSLQGAYKCRGNLTEWVQCDNIVLEPKRRAFSVPPELIDNFDTIKFKPRIGKRIIKSEERSVVLNPGPSTSSDEPKVKSERLFPLKNMEFVILGKLKTPKDELKMEILKLGGKVTTKIHSKLAAVISTTNEVEKMSKRMAEVEEANIQVVPEEFIQESMAGNAIDNIGKLNIASWGSDAKKRLEGIESMKSGSLGKSNFKKSGKSSKVTLKVKGGSAVDPESGLEDTAHVYTRDKDVYSAVLNLTDVVKGFNKYYRLQVLEADRGNKYWLFRAWGRTGTTIGGTKLDNMSSQQEAIKQFKFYYHDKTGNQWDNRHNFKKLPNMMVPMDLDMGVDESDSVALLADNQVESKLPKPVQDLVSMLFNVDTMKKVMLEFEIDLDRMPLGKISKKQIQTACSVLSELQRVLEQEDNRLVVIDATNRFYTLIPHDFGINQPPLLDNLDIIKSKMEMLESLLEIEIAYSLLKSSGTDKESSSLHPVDLHYQKLNAEIQPLPRDAEEFTLLEKYVKNTHAATHTQYSLTIEEIFKVTRSGEHKRYKPFRKLHNKKLLWHGSRLTNFAGILSQGLRIAPPEAPSTGYMFGKGVYFADMVSKSANYCMTSPTNNTGLMMLCEVALGDMYERTQADYIEKLPPGKHSCKGVGATCPDPAHSHTLEDGVEVPYGPATTVIDRHKTSLLYNEYIVYDVAQIKTRYLFRLKFDYKF